MEAEKEKQPLPRGIFGDVRAMLGEVKALLILYAKKIREAKNALDKKWHEGDKDSARAIYIEALHLRDEARAALLFYGYLKNRPYHRIETSTHATPHVMSMILWKIPRIGGVIECDGTISPLVHEELMMWYRLGKVTPDDMATFRMIKSNLEVIKTMSARRMVEQGVTAQERAVLQEIFTQSNQGLTWLA